MERSGEECRGVERSGVEWRQPVEATHITNYTLLDSTLIPSIYTNANVDIG